MNLFLSALFASTLPAPATRIVSYNGRASTAFTYSASVVPAAGAKKTTPPLVLLPPIGVGIDRTFCVRLLEEWQAAAPPTALHSIDVVGMGDSQPKPKMARTLTGGWEVPPRTPAEWAEQTVAYIRDEIGEPAIVIGQSNLCAVALEAAVLDPDAVCGVVLVGPPALEALSIDKPQESIDKIWKITGSPIGAALYRFARRKAFLSSFSKKNLFADPSLVDDRYLDICANGAADADIRHAVFSFVAGTWRRNYQPLLETLTTPTLILSGKDIGESAKTGGGVGKGPSPPPASSVDKTSFGGLLKWFKVAGKGGDQKAGEFDQVARDLGTDPEVKLRDFVEAMPAASAKGTIETGLLPGWNVPVYESPKALAESLSGFAAKVSKPTKKLPKAAAPIVEELKAKITALAKRTFGGAKADESEAAEMERLIGLLEGLNKPEQEKPANLVNGEWDQIYTSNTRGPPITYADGKLAKRKMLGPIAGRLTQIISLSDGTYKQRAQAYGLGRAEMTADLKPISATEWDVKFKRFGWSLAGVPLKSTDTSGYTGTWTTSFVDEDTRVMRTKRADGEGGEFVFVLKRR